MYRYRTDEAASDGLAGNEGNSNMTDVAQISAAFDLNRRLDEFGHA